MKRSKRIGYSWKWDAHFSRKTGRWLEGGCGGKYCLQCALRPKRHHNPKKT